MFKKKSHMIEVNFLYDIKLEKYKVCGYACYCDDKHKKVRDVQHDGI